ncbi:hypothetical protein KKC83_06860 [Patescibacteria group bacterium]|nr:hypothetical protein [Patescibacteria group bacterium]MBU4580766.1 hypothetical protein [Patescibacteria group bacterium]
MTTSRNEVKINTSQQQALINHFIRKLFGNEGLRADVPKFSPEEYSKVLQEFSAGNCTSLQNSIENDAIMFDPYKQEVVLSFLRHYALKELTNSEVVSIKDHLANNICMEAIGRFSLSFSGHVEDPLRHD